MLLESLVALCLMKVTFFSTDQMTTNPFQLSGSGGSGGGVPRNRSPSPATNPFLLQQHAGAGRNMPINQLPTSFGTSAFAGPTNPFPASVSPFLDTAAHPSSQISVSPYSINSVQGPSSANPPNRLSPTPSPFSPDAFSTQFPPPVQQSSAAFNPLSSTNSGYPPGYNPFL